MDIKVVLLLICSVSIFEKVNGFEFFECPSGPKYKITKFGPDQTCYYFEADKKSFAQAQNNCATKFRTYEGKLAEPQTAERSTLLNKYAQEILNNQNNYWIGYDDLGHGTGNFRYSSTNGVSSIIGKGYDTIDGNNDEHCAGFFYAPSYGNFYGDVDDMKCEREFSSICEIQKS